MKTLLFVLLSIAGLCLVVALFFFIYGREKSWELVAGSPDLGAYDFDRAKRRSTPNDALLCTPPLCGDAVDGALPEYEEAPAVLIARLDEQISQSSEPVKRVDGGSDPHRLRYVVHTPTMRYPDTVDIEAVALDGGKTGLRAYGRAKIGRKDFGNNLKRLKTWLGAD